jgi:hypothetical protein
VRGKRDGSGDRWPIKGARRTTSWRRNGRGRGVWFTAPSGGRKRGPVPRALEQGEGLGAGSGQCRQKRVTGREIGEGARWWGPVWRVPVGRPRKKEKKWAQP